jgi:hypothetical protein
MVRRWLVRSFFLALLFLCVGIWAGSYWQITQISYWRESAAGASVGIWRGKAVFYSYFCIRDVDNGPVPKWSIYFNPPAVAVSDYIDGMDAKYRFAGFQFDPRRPWGYLKIPLWFPTILSGFLAWFIWRKTQPKYRGRAFPIEPASQSKIKA